MRLLMPRILQTRTWVKTAPSTIQSIYLLKTQMLNEESYMAVDMCFIVKIRVKHLHYLEYPRRIYFIDI